MRVRHSGAKPRITALHSELQTRILRLGIEAGAVLVDVGEVAVAEDAGVGMISFQATEQSLQGTLLWCGACVGGPSFGRQSALIADADGVLVGMPGMQVSRAKWPS